jgi:hypothetical protein
MPPNYQGKQGESPPLEAEQPLYKTFALVVLLQRHSLAMAIDFAAFKKEFDARGIQAEYRSLYDLDEIIEANGDLIYGRDDIPRRSREVLLTKGHEKFYSIVNQPQKMRDGILGWLRSVVPVAEANDNILLVLISHGTNSGSVVIGGEQASAPVKYLTNIDIRQAVVNLRRHTYFTVIITCYYSGGWINIARTGLGKRFLHAASGKNKKAELTSSGKHRGGLFVTALLECLKRNGDGTLSEFVAEIKAEVTSCRSHETSEEIPAATISAISHSNFWKRPLNAFIPIHTDSSLPEMVSTALENVKSVTLAQLFERTRPAKRRRVIPDEVVREIRDAQRWASRRGGSNGEDQIYHACQEVLDGNANQSAREAVFRTISWREKTRLQAERIARHLDKMGIIKLDMINDIDDETLTTNGRVYYNRVFSGSKIIDHTKLPPNGCIGGLWENPLTWLSNLIASSEEPVSMARLKESVENFLAEAVITRAESRKEKN